MKKISVRSKQIPWSSDPAWPLHPFDPASPFNFSCCGLERCCLGPDACLAVGGGSVIIPAMLPLPLDCTWHVETDSLLQPPRHLGSACASLLVLPLAYFICFSGRFFFFPPFWRPASRHCSTSTARPMNKEGLRTQRPPGEGLSASITAAAAAATAAAAAAAEELFSE